jgi:hypothetical protein
MRFEIGGVKMKKNGKKKKTHVLQFEKTYFFYCSFLASPWALHCKDDL